METITEILKNNSIWVDNYTEDDKFFGYELNTYTDGGVNEIIFLDFRQDGDPSSADDFIKKLENWLNDFDIDETIDMYREDENYKNNFSLSQSLKDFKRYKKEIKRVIKKLKE
jgi:hypothetical protein